MTQRVPRNRFQRNPWKHGHAADRRPSPEYSAWFHMNHRCNIPTHKSYPDYGGRGIQVCDRWRSSFENFLADMGERPSPKHSLERLNNSGNYEPDNCKWATQAEQNNNTRHNVVLTFNGKSQNIIQWERELGFPRNLIGSRLKRGWSIARTLSTPLDQVMSGYRKRGYERAQAQAEHLGDLIEGR